jgi:hypothetical protein
MNIQIEVPMLFDWPVTWSKIQMFKTCHWKFYLHEGSKFITGKAEIPFSTNRAMQLGEEKHDLYEKAAFSLKNGNGIPQALRQSPLWNDYVGGIIAQLMAIYPDVSIEEKLGLDSTWRAWALGKYWQPDKSLFGNRKMLIRTKFDLALFNACIWEEPTHALIVDYKSGKARKADANGQLALYALTAFCSWPSLERIDCTYIFVDHNARQDEVYYKSNIPDLKQTFADYTLEIQQYLKEASTKLLFNDCTVGSCHWCSATVNQCIKSSKEG